jgi:hypothetical protein
MKIFDYLNSMTKDKTPLDFSSDEVSKGYSPFMINRWVSMVDVFAPFANDMNKYDVPKDVHYEFYKSFLPKRKTYFPYIKKAKDLDLHEKKYICHYFEIGLKEADQYINIMSEEEVKEVLDIYKYGKNKFIEL